MKIVHVINSLATGGAERFLVDLVECGNKMGHDVSIISIAERAGIPHQIAKERGLKLTTLGQNLFDPRNILRLKKLTKDAEIVHVHLFPALYLAAFIDRPKVFTEHSSHNNRRNRKALSLFEKWAYGQYDRIIAISDGVEEALGAHLRQIHSKTKVSLALNGVTEEFFSVIPEYSLEPTRIVIVGSLRAVKQHSLALQSIALLKNVSLTIAGDGELRETLENQANELGVENRVNFLGDVDDVPTLLKNHDLLLSTSKYEGMSTVAVEAQAAGIPVVGPDVPGIRDVVQHGVTGLLFSEHKPEAIADTITRALDPAMYKVLASATKPHASQYSIQNSFLAQVKIYQELVK